MAKSDVAANGRNPVTSFSSPATNSSSREATRAQRLRSKTRLRTIDGVEARVVETCETQGGELIEICQNYLAVSQKTNDVFCFGQNVDIYLGGRVVAHDGSWSAGTDGATCMASRLETK